MKAQDKKFFIISLIIIILVVIGIFLFITSGVLANFLDPDPEAGLVISKISEL